MTHSAPLPLLPYCPSNLAEQLLLGGQRILLFGETGIGKSTLTAELTRILSERGLSCFCIAADPGPASICPARYAGTVAGVRLASVGI